MISKELQEFLDKHYEGLVWKLISNDGKHIQVEGTIEDEKIKLWINRRKGTKGNFRIVMEG